MFVILLYYIIINSQKIIKRKGNIFGIVTYDGLGNRIAGIPGTFLLSLLSNRYFHRIIIYIA